MIEFKIDCNSQYSGWRIGIQYYVEVETHNDSKEVQRLFE